MVHKGRTKGDTKLNPMMADGRWGYIFNRRPLLSTSYPVHLPSLSGDYATAPSIVKVHAYIYAEFLRDTYTPLSRYWSPFQSATVSILDRCIFFMTTRR